MFCNKCGAENKDGVRFCSKCGAPMPAHTGINQSVRSSVPGSVTVAPSAGANAAQVSSALNSTLSSNKTLIMLAAGVLVIIALLLPFAKISFDTSAVLGDNGPKSSFSVGFKDTFALTDLVGLVEKIAKAVPDASNSFDADDYPAGAVFVLRAVAFVWVNLIGALVWGLADILRGKGTKILRIALIVAAVVFVLMAIGSLVLRGSLAEGSHDLAKLRPTIWSLLGAVIGIGAPIAEKQLQI